MLCFFFFFVQFISIGKEGDPLVKAKRRGRRETNVAVLTVRIFEDSKIEYCVTIS